MVYSSVINKLVHLPSGQGDVHTMAHESDPQNTQHDIPPLHHEGVSDPQVDRLSEDYVKQQTERLQNAPTGIPPVGHRHEDLFGDRVEKKSHRGIIALGAGVTAVAVGLVGYFGTRGGDKPASDPTHPVATAPANPGKSHETNPSVSASEKSSSTTSPEFKSAAEVPDGFLMTTIPDRLSTDSLSSKSPNEIESAFAIKSASSKIDPKAIATEWTEGYTAIGNLGCSEKYLNKYSDSIGNFDMDKFEKDSSDFAVTAFKGLNGSYGVDSAKTTEWKTQLANRCGTVYGVRKYTDKTLQPYQYQMMMDPSSVKYDGVSISFDVFETDNIDNKKLNNDGMGTYPAMGSGKDGVMTVYLETPTVNNNHTVDFKNIGIRSKAN